MRVEKSWNPPIESSSVHLRGTRSSSPIVVGFYRRRGRLQRSRGVTGKVFWDGGISSLQFWLSEEGTRRGNTLDKLESRLSAWLPRIMDVTVTHVNEAHHLHLLHLLAYPVPSIVSLIAAEMSSHASLRFVRWILQPPPMNSRRNWQLCSLCFLLRFSSRRAEIRRKILHFASVDVESKRMCVTLADVQSSTSIGKFFSTWRPRIY